MVRPPLRDGRLGTIEVMRDAVERTQMVESGNASSEEPVRDRGGIIICDFGNNGALNQGLEQGPLILVRGGRFKGSACVGCAKRILGPFPCSTGEFVVIEFESEAKIGLEAAPDRISEKPLPMDGVTRADCCKGTTYQVFFKANLIEGDEP